MLGKLAVRFLMAGALLGALVAVAAVIAPPGDGPALAMTVNRQWLAPADWAGSSKSVSPAGGAQGDIITYTLHIVRAGAASAASVIVNDPLPAGLEFIPPLEHSSDVPLVVGGPTYANHTVTYEGNPLETWSELWITITLRVLTDTGVLTNSLYVYGFSGDQPVVRSAVFYVTPSTPTATAPAPSTDTPTPAPPPTDTPTPAPPPTDTPTLAPPPTDTPTLPPPTDTPTPAPPPTGTPSPLPPPPAAPPAAPPAGPPDATATLPGPATPAATPTRLPTLTPTSTRTATPEAPRAPASDTPAAPAGLTYDVSDIRLVEDGVWSVALCVTNPGESPASLVQARLQVDRGTLIEAAYSVDARVLAGVSGARLVMDALPAGQRLWLAVFVESADRPAAMAEVDSSLGASRRVADPACAAPDRGGGAMAVAMGRSMVTPAGASSDAPDTAEAPDAPGPLNVTVPVMREAGLPTLWICGGGLAALFLLLAAALLLAGRRRSEGAQPADPAE